VRIERAFVLIHPLCLEPSDVTNEGTTKKIPNDGLEQRGLLTSTRERHGGIERRVYQATPAGRKALAAAKTKVRELFGELFEDEEECGS
jgi:hypothetical protein